MFASCQQKSGAGRDDTPAFYKVVNLQPRVGKVVWNSDEFDFEKANEDVIELYASFDKVEEGMPESCQDSRMNP